MSPETTHSDARQPRQARSRRTLARILAATETLLEEKPFEAITIEELVRAARTSTGSLYSRIGSKEGLLPLLYERYDAALHETMTPVIDEVGRRGLELDDLARVFVQETIRRFTEKRWLIRAIGLHIRAHPESLSPEKREQRRELHERLAALFDPHLDRIGGEDPRARVIHGLYFAGAVLRDKIIFGAAPHAQATPFGDQHLEDEVTRMLLAYLTS